MVKILVPVDFSDTSINALMYATRLFEKETLEITLLHVYGTRSPTLIMKNFDHVIEKGARRKMEKIRQEVLNVHSQATLNLEIRKENTITRVVNMAAQGECDYIVMGTKGASGLKEVFLGSVAGGVVTRSKVPVLVVPDQYVFKSMDQVVLALGRNPLEEEVLEPLKFILALHRSGVKLLHFSEGREPGLEKAKLMLEEFKPEIIQETSKVSVNEDMIRFLRTTPPSLLCLIRSKKGFFARLIGESVTLKQTFHSPIPILVLREQ